VGSKSMRGKMSRENRAKQFMPFAALTGHREVLAQRERETAEKAEISEDMKEEINDVLMQISKGDMVRIKFYDIDCYKEISGMVVCVDKEKETIIIVQTEIKFDDIYSIWREGFV